jgi:translocation and assembly module TamA
VAAIAPRPLKALLSQHLDLARVNRQAPGEVLSESELERLVAQAPQQAKDLLETEGYFNATVQVAATPGQPPLVRVAVEPGPQATVGSVQLQLQGPLVQAADAGDAGARQARAAFPRDWTLPVGAPFRDEDWSRAKALSMARLRARGYVAADWTATLARVDASANLAHIEANAFSGPLYRAGPLRIRGLQRQDEQTVRNLADYAPGTPATETFLLDFQERLQKSGLFDRATVTLAENPADPAATPVDVRLTEHKLQDLTAGIGLSANVGPRATLEHVHRRPFDAPYTVRNKLDVAQLAQKLEGEVSTHTLPHLYRNLVGYSLSREVSDTDTVFNGSLRVGRAQDTKRISRLAFVEADRSVTKNALGTSTANALAAHYQGVWREVDNLLLPTRGQVWTGQVAVGQASSDPGTAGPFSRLYAKLDAYRPLGGGWYGQGRVELGQVFSRAEVVVPEALRFRAGGDESVRGYAYRSLTPQRNGVDVSGKVLFTSSAEVARPMSPKLPELWGAAFVDAGRAAMQWSELHPAVGYGVGLRYRSPVGPVKLDLAYGQEVHRLRLHLSVGVNF